MNDPFAMKIGDTSEVAFASRRVVQERVSETRWMVAVAAAGGGWRRTAWIDFEEGSEYEWITRPESPMHDEEEWYDWASASKNAAELP